MFRLILQLLLIVLYLLHHRGPLQLQLIHHQCRFFVIHSLLFVILHCLCKFIFHHVLILSAFLKFVNHVFLEVHHIHGEARFVFDSSILISFFLLAFVDIFLRIIYFAEMDGCIGRFLRNLHLFLIVTVFLELINHVP